MTLIPEEMQQTSLIYEFIYDMSLNDSFFKLKSEEIFKISPIIQNPQYVNNINS
jgi:hypothetical protein